MRSTIKVRSEPLVVNEQQMLNRILAVLQTSNDLRQYVQYEFVNFAPSLFDAVSMRKTAKAALNRSLDVDSNLVVSPGILQDFLNSSKLLQSSLANRTRR